MGVLVNYAPEVSGQVYNVERCGFMVERCGFMVETLANWHPITPFN